MKASTRPYTISPPPARRRTSRRTTLPRWILGRRGGLRLVEFGQLRPGIGDLFRDAPDHVVIPVLPLRLEQAFLVPRQRFVQAGAMDSGIPPDVLRHQARADKEGPGHQED